MNIRAQVIPYSNGAPKKLQTNIKINKPVQRNFWGTDFLAKIVSISYPIFNDKVDNIDDTQI